MTDSQRLLADYMRNGSEAAFRELVARYIDLTYSTALRLVDGDAHLAQDVTQTVFADLARMARTLSSEVMLGGWLHRHACFVAAKTMRGERRRQSRERQAVEMNALHDHSEANLAQVAPILDEAIDRLGAEDRSAIILRFFEQRDLRSVGEALGTSENAARMRVTRALEKLQSHLKHRGIAFSTTTLGTALASEVVTAAPAGLAASISSSAFASAALGGGTALTLFKLMAMTKLKLGLVGAIVVTGVVAPLVMQHQVRVKLREENEALRQQAGQLAQLAIENERLSNLVVQLQSASTPRRVPAPRLPAPPMNTAVAPAGLSAEESDAARRILKLLQEDKPRQLTAQQVKPYLDENRRSAASLLAAFRATGDPALLQEALEKYPGDPQVNFAAVFKKDAAPEERRQRLEAFKQSAPDNALANYLSALDYFKAGQTDQAVQELSAASGKPLFQDYTVSFLQDNDDVWLTAGYPLAESKVIASVSLVIPHLAEMKQLAQNTVTLADAYRQAGDETSAQLALQMGANLGQRFGGTGGEPLVSQLVGMAVESIALRAMDPASAYGGTGYTAKDRLDELTQQRSGIRDLIKQFVDVQAEMSAQDWISYIDRWRIFGEQAAEQWAVNKHGRK